MSDSAETMREAIKRFHRNCCYPEAFDFEVDGLMNELAALSASGTKSDGTAGKDADPQRNRLLGEDTPEKGAGVAPGPSDWTPSELLYFGLADATKVRIRLERGHGSIVHVFDRADIKHLRNALRPSDPIPSPSAPPLSAPVRRLKGGM